MREKTRVTGRNCTNYGFTSAKQLKDLLEDASGGWGTVARAAKYAIDDILNPTSRTRYEFQVTENGALWVWDSIADKVDVNPDLEDERRL